MSDHNLILHPTDPYHQWATPENVLNGLAEFGLLGAHSPWDATHYQAGPHFFDLVVFARSHTTVVLGDTPIGLQEVNRVDSRTLCTVKFADATPEPEFLGGANTVAPLCPHCLS